MRTVEAVGKEQKKKKTKIRAIKIKNIRLNYSKKVNCVREYGRNGIEYC